MGWREWTVSRTRAWVGYALGLVALLGIGASAYVGSISPPTDPRAAVSAAADAEGAAEGHAVENHGRCVSRAAKAARDAGLKGPDKGAFMSSIAKDEGLVADKDGEGNCEFSSQLDDGLASQAERPERGKPEDAPGAAKGLDAKPDKPEKPVTPADDPGELELPEL